MRDEYKVMIKTYGFYFTKETYDYIKDNAIIYEEIPGSIPPLRGSLNVELLNEAYNRMKEWNKSFILIIDRTEANWYALTVHEKIHELCEQTGVPADKIVHITNDLKCNETYNKWFKRQTKYKTKMNFVGYPSNLFVRNADVHKLLKETGISYKLEKYKDREILPTKKFMCLMGHTSRQRNFLWNLFETNPDIKKDGHISYLQKGVCLPNSSTHTDKQLIENYWSAPSNDRLQSYHADTYFSIVSEGEAGHAFSEKIHKALLHCHPFILLSCNTIDDDKNILRVGVGMLGKLKEWGFETFPELFDESYDNIDDFEKRNNNVKQTIVKLCNMKTKELHKLCESVEEKCIYNQKIMFSLEIPNKQVVSKLEKLL